MSNKNMGTPPKIYVAGPMQGIANFNFPMFNRVAGFFENIGYVVFNPAQRDIERHGGVDISQGNETGDIKLAQTEHKFSLRDALADDTNFICKEATHIVMLPGWERSNGARAEHALAVALDLKRVYWNEDVSNAA